MAEQITELRLTELHPYANNPRINDAAVEPVANSIREFGFKVPIVAKTDGEIINGHTRYKAAQFLGLDTVPVIIADDLTDEQVQAFRLADNKVAEIADWDMEALEQELAEIRDIDMNDFGFETPDEYDDVEPVDDDVDIDELMEDPVAKTGQVWKLGRHRLMVGDSTSEADVKKLMGGQLLDLIVTDPPYNVAYEGKTKDALKIENDQMDSARFRLFLTDAFKAADAVLKPGAGFYIWYASREHINFESAALAVGWDVKQQLIWVKNTMVLGRQDYQWKHEPALYGWKPGDSHYFINDRTNTTVIDEEIDPDKMSKADLVDLVKEIQRQLEPGTTIREDKPARNGEHPTMKPVPLFGRLIANSSKPGDNVGDFFGGSGTTLIAAEQLGRNGFAMELDPHYADVIIHRWENFTGETAELLNE